MGETFRVKNQQDVLGKPDNEVLNALRNQYNTLQNIEGILQRIEKKLFGTKDKFAPVMVDRKGNAYPLVGKPTARP